MLKTETYDIVVSTPYSYGFFVHNMRELCGQMRLSFFLVNELWAQEFLEKLESKKVAANVFIDLSTNQRIPNDPFTVLAKAARECGAYMIDDPDRTAEVTHKGYSHQALQKSRVSVPETVVLKREELSGFKIDDDIERRIGIPFVVKPARGYGGFGVNVDGRSEGDLQRCAEACPEADTFLIQRRLTMKDLGRHTGWFRMFYICGTVIACWWDPASHQYHLVTPSQIKKYKLTPLRSITRQIARMTKLKKFSSEICLHEDGRFYAVDYVNSCPDMNPQSFYSDGVPDEVVRYIVWLMFYEGMHVVKRSQGFFDQELSDSETDADEL